MNSIPGSYPTTSDISAFMHDVGFKWSNDAQIYYNDNGARYAHLTRNVADGIYKKLFGDNPYSGLPTSSK